MQFKANLCSLNCKVIFNSWPKDAHASHKGPLCTIFSGLHLHVFVTLGTMGDAWELTMNRKTQGTYPQGSSFFLGTVIKDLCSLKYKLLLSILSHCRKTIIIFVLPNCKWELSDATTTQFQLH